MTAFSSQYLSHPKEHRDRWWVMSVTISTLSTEYLLSATPQGFTIALHY